MDVISKLKSIEDASNPNETLDYFMHSLHKLINEKQFDVIDSIISDFDPEEHHVRLTLALLTYIRVCKDNLNSWPGDKAKIESYLVRVKGVDKATQILERLE